MTKPPASKRSEVAPFIAMDVMRNATRLERERAGGNHPRIIHLEVGQPSTPAPKLVREAAAAALSSDRLGYTDALGVPILRQRISAFYRDRHGLSVDPERVVITAGSSGGFVLSFLACFDVGGRIALAEPAYPAYRNILAALGLEVIGIPVGGESRWALTPQHVEEAERRHGRIAGVLVASPANPTGTMMEPASLAALARSCEASGRWFISDEIYHGISYGMEEATALSFSEDAIVANSFSKYYSMTGWRLGWLVVPERLLRPMERLAQNIFISPPSLSQLCAAAAFDAGGELDENVAIYARNRRLLMDELQALGMEIAPPDGAFYLYADVGRHLRGGEDSVAFCQRMLEETGIAATPGIDFDPSRGGRAVRFSYAGAYADMEEAASRLKRWL